MQYRIVIYGHHAVHKIPRIYSSYNWKFYHLTNMLLINSEASVSAKLLRTYNLLAFWLGKKIIFQGLNKVTKASTAGGSDARNFPKYSHLDHILLLISMEYFSNIYLNFKSQIEIFGMWFKDQLPYNYLECLLKLYVPQLHIRAVESESSEDGLGISTASSHPI